MIVGISLQVLAVYNLIGFDDSLVWWSHVHSFYRWSVQVDSVVYHKQRVIVVHDIIIDTDSIEVLFEETLEEHILLLQSRLLLVNGQLI
jgi:hypothetical protein